jgi:hypothetical protein
VRQWIINEGFCDEIIVHYVDCDPTAFDGFYVQRRLTISRPGVYADPVITREIFINRNLSEENRRVAEIKETLHILDIPLECTVNPASVKKVIDYAATRVNLSAEPGAIQDVVALPQALAILFPWEMRRLLRPHVEAGNVSVEEIAQVLRIPEVYAGLVLSDEWEAWYRVVLPETDGVQLRPPPRGPRLVGK